MSDVSNLRDTIVPKSDQLNAEQLLAGPIDITVTGVTRGTDDQPVVIRYEGDAGRPYKPCKSMRKVLIFAWGDDGRAWVGRSMRLYNNPDVKFGGVKVGGIRISHMSNIERDVALSLTATKGKKEQFIIARMETPVAQVTPQVAEPIADPDEIAALDRAASEGMGSLQAAWGHISQSTKKAVGKPGLDRLKEKAANADAAKAAQSEPEPSAEAEDDVF